MGRETTESNLINLPACDVDTLKSLLHRDIQEWMATDEPENVLNIQRGWRNHDSASELLRLYDLLSNVSSKWTAKQPQFCCKPGDHHEVEKELIKGTDLYLAMDGNLKSRHRPD